MPLTVARRVVRRLKDVELLLRAAADKVAINSATARNLVLLQIVLTNLEACITPSIDCKAINGSWEVFTRGGLRATGINAIEHASIMKQLEFANYY
ncbi:MAG: HisA/HisF-related TIM barrel protein [Candidatus Hodgkinia cicadicola]